MSYKWLTYKHNIQARCYLFRTLEFKSFISIPIYISIDGSFSFTQDYFLSLRIVVLLLYYLYCLCKLFKDRFFLRWLFFSESGCKGKNFIRYLPNIFGSFFYFSFSSSSLCAKGRQKKKEKVLGTVLNRKTTGAGFIWKAGAKVRTLRYIFQMFRKFFFIFLFSGDDLIEIIRKREELAKVLTPFSVRMSKYRCLRSRKRMQK